MDFILNLNVENVISGNKKIELDFDRIWDVLIIGGGPAGLNAALYSLRKGLSTGLITGKSGGQITDTSLVENYLGFPSLSGEALAKKFENHVSGLELPVLAEDYVLGIELVEDGLKRLVMQSGKVLTGRAVIIASGSRPRQLNVPGEQELLGRGVAYCAICDGPLFKNKTVVVAGGGNSAVEAALDLSKIAEKVLLVHRSKLRADRILIDRMNRQENITVHLETEILEIKGASLMEGVRVRDSSGEKTLQSAGIFVEIGYIPNSGAFKDFLQLKPNGEIIINERNETSVPGIFAAGDVTQVPYKQISIAAGEGAKAALSANDYLNRLKG